MVDDFVGKQIGSYRLVEKVKYGAFGYVYIAKHDIFEDEPVVAVKLIRAHPNVQQEFFRRLELRENSSIPTFFLYCELVCTKVSTI